MKRKAYERVVCLNAQNGDIIWKFLISPLITKIYGIREGPRASVLIHKDNAFGFGARGRLSLLDARNGEKYGFVIYQLKKREFSQSGGFPVHPK